MATLESEDSNIIDAETVSWRMVVYPIVVGLVLLLGGFGYYYYLQNQRIAQEGEARAALLQSKSPEELAKVADQFPKTTQATLALLAAADLFYTKKDYPAALQAYQRIAGASSTDAALRDSAQLGVASTLEVTNKPDEAITAYLVVAHRGAGSPYGPFGYMAAARLYEEKNDQENERKILSELAALHDDSPFVKEAQVKLKTLSPAPSLAPATSSNAPASATPHS